MTEKQVRQLLKLLDQLRMSKNAVGADYFDPCARGILLIVCQWIRWYAHDELSVDL